MKKLISVLLLLFALGLLFVDWIVYEPIGESLVNSLQELEELIVEQGNAQPFPKEALQKFAAQADTGMSPYEISSFMGIMGRLVLGRPSPDEETIIAGVILLLIQGVFWVEVVFLVKLVAQHIFGRRPRGVGATMLMMLLLVAFHQLVQTTNADYGTQELALTAVGFAAVGAMVASCIVWSAQLRKVGAQKGRWSLTTEKPCPKCGMMQPDNMFCDNCGTTLER